MSDWKRTSVWWAEVWDPEIDHLGMHPDENPFPRFTLLPPSAAWVRCVRRMLRLTG